MKRVIFYDGEWLKRLFPDFERYNRGALTMVFEMVKTRFVVMLRRPDKCQEYLITEMDLFKDDHSGACYALVVDGRQVQVKFHYHDLDVRGYNSWLLTCGITFEGDEVAVLRLNQLLNSVAKSCRANDLVGEVRGLLSANFRHHVLIDDRRPFCAASC